MKKVLFGMLAIGFISTQAFAQEATKSKKSKKKVAQKVQIAPKTTAPVIISPAPAVDAAKTKIVTMDNNIKAATTTNNLNPDLSMKFNTEDHNFGNLPEGPSATYDFEFKNIGNTPIILSEVHGSCGCTTPVWPKEPVLPGKTAKIAVTYATQGRPGPINKTVTVTSNVGTKIIKISGNVEKAATPAAPATAPAQDPHAGHNH
jgi:hypothetical protein